MEQFEDPVSSLVMGFTVVEALALVVGDALFDGVADDEVLEPFDGALEAFDVALALLLAVALALLEVGVAL